MTNRAELAAVAEFLAQRRMAVVGISRNPQHFSRLVWNELRARGYDLVPVSVHAREIDGTPAFPRVSEIPDAVEAAMVMTPAEQSLAVVRDCARSHVPRVWLHRGGGKGSVSDDAVGFCAEHDITVIPGECPMMFLPNAAWYHRFHGWCRKLTGNYPR